MRFKLTVEEVYVNSFDATEVGWTETGNSPYLQDTNTDYIRSNITLKYESKFGFPNSVGSGAINSVKIRVEVETIPFELGCEAFVYVWDGASWVLLGHVYSDNVYVWIEFDVSAILNTWDKINGAKLRFLSSVEDGTVYVRRATRKVDYTVAAVSLKMVGDGLTCVVC